jgi:hypothetical protein
MGLPSPDSSPSLLSYRQVAEVAGGWLTFRSPFLPIATRKLPIGAVAQEPGGGTKSARSHGTFVEI